MIQSRLSLCKRPIISILTVYSTIAVHLSEAVPKDKDVIIDAFAGVGGNAIAFAREGRWRQVFAIEKDPATLKCAKHNAKIYGVDKKIVWINGDCFDVLEKRFAGSKNAVVFASPPWGGKSNSLLFRFVVIDWSRHRVSRCRRLRSFEDATV
jgi:tRNA/tmRNA/rRNA uracil-C5-methylase (TrmA/RlmC/RlmD family)